MIYAKTKLIIIVYIQSGLVSTFIVHIHIHLFEISQIYHANSKHSKMHSRRL